MMEAASLQAPTGSGRSRFSKALPAPPPFLQQQQQQPPRGSSLPQSQQQPSFPGLPPTPRKLLPASPAPFRSVPDLPLQSREDIREGSTMTATKADLPLPPLPSTMAIPRRPVGGLPSPAETSPVTSISSILSAYSTRSSSSTQRSSTAASTNDTAASSRAVSASATVPTEKEGRSGDRKNVAPFAASYSGLSQDVSRPENKGLPQPTAPEEKEEDLPPPPPMKDPARANRAPGSPLPPLTPTTSAGSLTLSLSSPRTGPRKGPSLMDTLMGTSSAAASPTPAPAQSPVPSQTPSQIWRRRSIRTETNLEVPELKLADSHGSTASSGQPGVSHSREHSEGKKSPTKIPSPIVESPLPINNDAKPLPPVSASLPGRNIRPTASNQQMAPTPKSDEQGNMGLGLSNLKTNLLKRGDAGGRRDDVSPLEDQESANLKRLVSLAEANRSAPNVGHPLSPVARLPTPEYGKDDVKSPVIEHVPQPESPATSPELPAEPKPVPTIQRKAIGAGSQNQVRPVKSVPTLQTLADAPSSPLPAPPTLRSPMPRSPIGLPSSPAPTRGKAPSPLPTPSQAPIPAPEPSRFPARPSSKPTEQQRPMTAPRQEPVGPDGELQVAKQRQQLPPRPQLERINAASEVGSVNSDETVKPRQKQPQSQNNIPKLRLSGPDPEFDTSSQNNEPEEEQTTDNPGAARFPRGWYTPRGQDDMLDAAPLQERHFRCSHAHKTWFASSQRYNPISCATCGDKDFTRDYWSCAHCHVRICPECRMNLQRKFRGDLGALMDDIEQRTIMDLYEVAPEDNEKVTGSAPHPIEAAVPVAVA